MLDDPGIQRIEDRIANGIAELSALSAEDIFPDIPVPAPESADRQEHDQYAPRRETWHYFDHDRSPHSLNYPDYGEASYLYIPNESESSTQAELIMPSEATAFSASASPLPYPQQPRIPDRHGASSAETLTEGEDDWIVLDRIASYLDRHQKTPIDASTGFNAVDGKEAAEALGLRELSDVYMIRLMQAGLLVHHYASSATPWRDAVSQVEYESRIEAQHEQRSDPRVTKQRLMRLLAEAVGKYEASLATSAVLVWRSELARVNMVQTDLLQFDYKTLAPPYLESWMQRSQSVSKALSLAGESSTIKTSKNALTTIQSRYREVSAADHLAERVELDLRSKNAWKIWTASARQIAEAETRAAEVYSNTIANQYLLYWRAHTLKHVLERRHQAHVVRHVMGDWRLKLALRSDLLREAVLYRDRNVFNAWTRVYNDVVATDSRVGAASNVILQNQAMTHFHVWLRRWRLGVAMSSIGKHTAASQLREWRSITRLKLYSQSKDSEIIKSYLRNWTHKLRKVADLLQSSQQIQHRENRALQQAVFKNLLWPAKCAIEASKVDVPSARELTSSRSSLAVLQQALQSIEQLESTASTLFMRISFRELQKLLSARRHERLVDLTHQATLIVEIKLQESVIRSWRLRRQSHAKIMENIEISSRYAAYAFGFNKWLTAFSENSEYGGSADAHFSLIAASGAITRWRTRMDAQIEGEIEASRQLNLRRALLAKRLLRTWRRKHDFLERNLAAWQEDVRRQIAVLYFHALQNELYSRRNNGGHLKGTDTLADSPQRTPSRHNVISAQALEMWSSQALPKPTFQSNNNGGGGWGATPLVRRVSPRGLSASHNIRGYTTPTKPARLLLKDLKLEEAVGLEPEA